MHTSYADVLESYTIAEEGLFSKDELKAIGLTGAIFIPIIAIASLIKYKQNKKSTNSSTKYIEDPKYKEYEKVTRNYSGIKDFVNDYNNSISNKVWVIVAKLPKMTIYVDNIYPKINDDYANTLTKIYSKVDEYRRFANGNDDGNNPHIDTMKKKIPPVLEFGKANPHIIFDCDPSEGEFIASVSHIADTDIRRTSGNKLLPKDDWYVEYDD